MLGSSPKRRRISTPEPGVDIGGQTVHTDAQPTTPTRASYRSPTKSSLARSHPHLISRSTRSVSVESRGRSLRDEILNKLPSGAGASAAGTIPRTPPQNDRPANESPTIVEDANLEAGLREKDEGTSGAGRIILGSRSPKLKGRLRGERGSSERRRSKDDRLLPVITPTLVQRGRSEANIPPRSRSDEPELPPTPVQLGLSAALDRPRGLASSSSPRRSLSGSGKNRRRTRGDGIVTSSPLKPKARGPVFGGEEVLPAEPDEVVEAQESEPDGRHNEDLSEESREKQTLLRSLREELQKLKRQNQRLENLIEKPNTILEEDLSLLGEAYSNAVDRDYASLGEEKLTAHLTIFAPSNLQLSSRTEIRQIKGRTKAVHFLTVNAPPPWLPAVFAFQLEVVTDTEDVRVEHVRVTDNGRTRSLMTGLHKWLNARRQDPLHRLDVGGTIRGMGRYFAAIIERAKIFQRLDKLYGSTTSSTSDRVLEEEDNELTQDKAIALSRWLNISKLILSVATPAVKAGSRESGTFVMLIWDMDLDWTGCVTSNVNIAARGISAEAEARLKEVFCALLPSRGVVGAFTSVRRLLQGENED